VPTDVKASATHYCRCVRLTLERAKERGVRPSEAFRLFGDAVHAVGAAVGFEEVTPGQREHEECVATLRRVAHKCGRSEVLRRAGTAAAAAEAALNAYHALGVDAFQQRDREEAARRYRQVLQVFETSGGAAVNTGRWARQAFDGATRSLRILEAETPEEHARAMQMLRAQLMQEDPERWEGRIARRTSLGPVGATQRPACAGCGGTPLTLKLCKGSCGGAGADGKFCSTECFARSWRAHKQKTGCRNVDAASGGAQRTTAAGASGAASPQRAPSATSGSQRPAASRAAAPAKQRILYKAVIDDNHGHVANFETTYDVDVALFAPAAAGDRVTRGEAFMRIVELCHHQSKEDILRLCPFQCFGCGAANPRLLMNNASAYLRLPPPQGPMMIDIVQPYCKRHGPCEAACRQHIRELHAALASELPEFPPHLELL
jgi:hypothetical protein